MDQPKCVKCGGQTAGYKCDACGEEAGEHDAAHGCGGERCMAKCAGCGQAEAKCGCK